MSSKANDNNNNNDNDNDCYFYGVRYTAKDLILYALSIGIEPTLSSKNEHKQGACKDDSYYLKYLYEHHSQFQAFPTFCLALTFWAQKIRHENYGSSSSSLLYTTGGIPPFPPPLMKKEDVIPRRFLIENAKDQTKKIDLSSYPLIHTWQSIVWNRPIPVPAATKKKANNNDNSSFGTTNHSLSFLSSLKDHSILTKISSSEVISITPKSIGTFVTTQTTIVTTTNDTTATTNTAMVLEEKYDVPLCTMQSTALVLGINPKNVSSFEALGVSKLTVNPQIPKEDDDDDDDDKEQQQQQQQQQQPILEWVFPTLSTQALFYRLTSGDSNHIHVDTSASEMLQSESKAPLLHGLFTLALGCRAVMMKLIDDNDENNDDYVIHKLEGKFSQPAFVGDVLRVKVWRKGGMNASSSSSSLSKEFLFIVLNDKTGVELLSCGYAEFVPRKIMDATTTTTKPIILSKL